MLSQRCWQFQQDLCALSGDGDVENFGRNERTSKACFGVQFICFGSIARRILANIPYHLMHAVPTDGLGPPY